MSQINRAIVFVHYDRDNLVDDYVYFYLKALKKHSTHLVFVTTSTLSKEDYQKVSYLSSHIIERENIGYDFMSYKTGLESFDYTQYDELLICNDSVYGPFYPLSALFERMSNTECDFWGMTDNNDMAYHLQSYFLLFKKSLLLDTSFSTFWEKVKVLNDKEEIIQTYEVGLTSYFEKKGFKSAVAIAYNISNVQKISIFIKKLTPQKIFHKLLTIVNKKYSLARVGKVNATLYFWKALILDYKMPFIKIKLLRENPNNINIDQVENVLSNVSDYDTKLIKNHLKRMKEGL
jgi:rhamnosyltransferase